MGRGCVQSGVLTVATLGSRRAFYIGAALPPSLSLATVYCQILTMVDSGLLVITS